MTPLPLLSLLALAALFTSCASQPPAAPEPDLPGAKAAGSHQVTMGKFTDSRKLAANYLGMIHGPKGGPHQKLETSLPVAQIVTQSFGHGLSEQGWAAESGPAHWTLSGEIKEFSCDRFQRAGALVDVVVRLTKTGEGKIAFAKSFTAEKADPAAATPQALQALADATLQQVVSSAMRDREFMQTVASE